MNRVLTRAIVALALVIGGMVGAAQAQQAPGFGWAIPQGVVNAKGVEQAYIVVLPFRGSDTPQQVTVTFARDGQTGADPLRIFEMPAAPDARRFVIPVNTQPGFAGVTARQLFSAKVYCPRLCTVQLEQHPADEATFFSAMRQINALPEIILPEPSGEKP